MSVPKIGTDFSFIVNCEHVFHVILRPTVQISIVQCLAGKKWGGKVFISCVRLVKLNDVITFQNIEQW